MGRSPVCRCKNFIRRSRLVTGAIRTHHRWILSSKCFKICSLMTRYPISSSCNQMRRWVLMNSSSLIRCSRSTTKASRWWRNQCLKSRRHQRNLTPRLRRWWAKLRTLNSKWNKLPIVLKSKFRWKLILKYVNCRPKMMRLLRNLQVRGKRRRT